jgi:hypothetical protein
MQIEQGHFGDTVLNGLRAVVIMYWSGAIHEGGGKEFMVLDERVDEAQRAALLTTSRGVETEVGATIWKVFSATLDEVFDPLYEAIGMALDVDAQFAHLHLNNQGIGSQRQPERRE